MGRIRTVKPELFVHEDLFEAERRTGLPLRLAFIGLFTVADREGRFRWKVRELKTYVMPHDDVDFTAIMDALVEAEFVQQYEADGKAYGCIPTFGDNQVINNREAESKLPAPPVFLPGATRAARVPDACMTRHGVAQGEGKGKEGKGKEGKEKEVVVADATPLALDATPDEVDQAVAQWNELAAECRLATCQRLTVPRRRAISARLRECGGLEGWGFALAKVRGSPFLQGENRRQWRASIDFLCQASSFTSLMEGAYDRSEKAFRNGFASIGGSDATGPRDGRREGFPGAGDDFG